ncbi:hypothetical protein [Maribellus mangrovi]|uniref:hypothetical protein n=1 Tax=Maribellus mangrovi TaxID=3133146 RepID=UPI0030EDB2D6
MKTTLTLGVLLLLFTFTGFAQRTYSEENLAQLSPEEINVLLKQANENKTIAWVFTIVGPVSMASMFVFNEVSDGISFQTAGLLFFGGALVTIIGIPMLLVNSSRVKKINKSMQDKLSLKIAPCSFHNYMAQGNQMGLTLRIRF